MMCMNSLGVDVPPKCSRIRKSQQWWVVVTVMGKGKVKGGTREGNHSLQGHFHKKLVWGLGQKSDVGNFIL